jgi:16S rRNA (cytosine967-C5)-methyltransferase
LQSLNGIEVFSKPFSAWDCCAASGGKSILLVDRFPSVILTATDIRESILINLRKRLSEAGIRNYSAFTADITSPSFQMKGSYDLIICDAPCSGSGTWARTPEQLRFFREEEIMRYVSLQKKIAQNASRFLRQGGYLLYITCSVFKMENEELVQSLVSDKLQIESQQYFIGYHERADTLFATLFRAL